VRVLFTADWQADFMNLDLCDKAWDEVLQICQKRKLTHIIVAGDLKHSYNPVDIRVVHWWVQATDKARTIRNYCGVLAG
jgi:hypothetical protein